MKKVIFITTILLGLTWSCQEDVLVETITKEEIPIKDAQLREGRMYFENKESLQYTFQKYADGKEQELADYMQKFYDKDFVSLIPIVTEKNEKTAYEQLQKRKAQILLKNSANTNTSNRMATTNSVATDEELIDQIDDLEEIIGSEAYAAFLNENAEIQVWDKIYKYTDCGLFIVDTTNYGDLDNFLQTNNISDDLLIRTDEEVAENFINTQPVGVVRSISSTINYFNRGNDQEEDAPVEDPGGGSSQPIAPPDMQNYINNLPNCNPHSGFFGSLFGDNKICEDRYENKRRVKTKAYNLDFLLVYSVGVAVKHQFKGWTGLWRTEATQEVGMGVTYAQFTYDLTPIMDIALANINMVTTSNNNRYYFGSNNNLPSQFNMQNYPKIFRDDIVIEKFRNGNSPFDALINQGIKLANNQLTSENLNKQFWNELWGQTNTLLANNATSSSSNNRTLLSKPYLDASKLLVQKSYRSHDTNIGTRSNTFDWGFSIKLGYDESSNNNQGGLSFSQGNFATPSNYKVSMYGIAKNNGVWHGSRLVF